MYIEMILENMGLEEISNFSSNLLQLYENQRRNSFSKIIIS